MSRASLLVGLCVAAVVAAWPAPARAEARTHPLSGRWNVVFDLPEGYYETPIEFTVAENGDVTGTVLGQLGTFRIEGAAGHLDGNKLTLSARTSYGKLKLSATLAGDRLSGKWFPAGFFAQLFFKGGVRGVRDKAYASTKPRQEVFDSVWSTLTNNFYAPDFNGVDIEALRQRYRPQAAAARTDGEFLAVVRKMLAELRSSHLDFFAEAAGASELYPAGARQTDAAARDITWKKLTPTTGYLRIESFDDGPQVVRRIDQAFAELGTLPALVIDLRGNGGGTLGAAMRLGDYFFAEARPVGYVASRAGLVRHNARSIDGLDLKGLPAFDGYEADALSREMERAGALAVTTGGRAETYRGRLVVLVDEYCYSMTEAFASVVKETHAATLVGRPTSGAMLGATTFAVEGGWTLMLPVWDFRTPGGVRVEGVGVAPDVRVKYREGKDADLAAALDFLKRNAPAPSR
ncbi:MAG TPA: S41 family peptidase [Pyrinomonadaceae bacterium]|jgi:hypothetical protein